MNKREVIVLVAMASSSYPSMQNRDPESIVNAWQFMLSDIEFELAKAAVIKVCRESDFFPSVAQIVKAAKELDPKHEKLPTAAEAWEEVNRQIAICGGYKIPTFSHEVVKRAATAIGFSQMCRSENPEADRAHFMRIYESMRSKYHEYAENERVLKLSGMYDVYKALASGFGGVAK